MKQATTSVVVDGVDNSTELDKQMSVSSALSFLLYGVDLIGLL